MSGPTDFDAVTEIPPFELDMPPISNLQVHEVVNNELIMKLRQTEIRLKQMQSFEAKNESHIALSVAEIQKLQLENSILRLQNMSVNGQLKGLSSSLALSNATCQRLQEEVLSLRLSLEKANQLRLNSQREVNELKSKFEVAMQVQVVCLKGEDQARGQLSAALKELEAMKEELANQNLRESSKTCVQESAEIF